ncbi:MAG: sulfatase-like hydrolase/transferase [Planctomycetota bacterium]
MNRPNIIVIMADDMGYGDFSLFNDGLTESPTLDELAGSGVVFSQHYSESPVCTPARAGFLTGRYHHRTGALDMRENRGLDRLARREQTVADMFCQAGYHTGLVGKWHNGSFGDDYHPLKRGFREFSGFRAGLMDYWDWLVEIDGTLHRGDGRYLTDVFTDEAVSYINRHSGEPFFLMLTYNAPHFPLQAPEEDIEPFRDKPVNDAVATLYGMIRRMDRGIERVLDALDQNGIADNTMVLFTSDNGPQISHGDIDLTRFNAGWRGHKTLVYEGGIRVPMIVRWPDGGLRGGVDTDTFCHFTDWLPTLCAAAGIDERPTLPLDGYNLLPVLRGEGSASPTERFWQWNRFSPIRETNAAMRDGAWKLVRPPMPGSLAVDGAECRYDDHVRMHREQYDGHLLGAPRPDIPLGEPREVELYNLDDDPGEQVNLAGRHPDRTRRMLNRLETWFDQVEAERRGLSDEHVVW